MVISVLPYEELLLKMKSGLDFANSQKDPNFFQCQLTTVRTVRPLIIGSSNNESYAVQIAYIPKLVLTYFYLYLQWT